jgi:hypothetical protein
MGEGAAKALPNETNVEGATSQSKSGTSINLSNKGVQDWVRVEVPPRAIGSDLNLITITAQKRAAVPRRARI